jgi:hypothetical protein
MMIPGGQTLDVNRPPIALGQGQVEVITWVSFSFASNGELVLPFLKAAVDGVGQIVAQLASV